MTSEWRFHFFNGLFNFKEAWSHWAQGLLGLLLFPLFMFVLGQMWLKFNSPLGNYTYLEVVSYIGVTEIFYMTFLRGGNIYGASSDFSLSLARPRSWLLMQFSALFGRTLGVRLTMVAIYVPILLVFGVSFFDICVLLLRLCAFLIPLGIIQGLYSLLFSSAHVRWEFTSYLTLPFSKLFLIFGGVFAPISDFSQTSREILLRLPPSDIFFQPAYFIIKGHFFGQSIFEWIFRFALQVGVLVILNIFFFGFARKHHQSIGG